MSKVQLLLKINEFITQLQPFVLSGERKNKLCQRFKDFPSSIIVTNLHIDKSNSLQFCHEYSAQLQFVLQ